MAGKKINGCIGSSFFRRIKIRGSYNTLGGGSSIAVIPFQEAAHIIPVFAVPFRPTVPGGKRTDLIQAACVPGFSDQIHASQDRIIGKAFQKGRVAHRSRILIPTENRSQIEAETVHTVIDDPVSQAVKNQLPDDRVVAVQRIAAAAEIIVIAIRGEHVINIVIKPLKGKERPLFIPFCSMVEYHIQDYFNPIFIQGPDKRFQLQPFLVIFKLCGITGIGGKETHGIIPPVIQKHPSFHLPAAGHFIEFKDRHQFHRVDSQLFQIGDFFH